MSGLKGKLQLSVFGAKHLEDKALVGTMSPFVQVEIGNVIKQTKTDKGGGKTPNFQGEVLEFNLTGNEDAMHLTCWHNGPLGTLGDKKIGRLDLSLKTLVSASRKFHPLVDPDDFKRNAGFVELMAQFSGTSSSGSEGQPSKQQMFQGGYIQQPSAPEMSMSYPSSPSKSAEQQEIERLRNQIANMQMQQQMNKDTPSAPPSYSSLSSPTNSSSSQPGPRSFGQYPGNTSGMYPSIQQPKPVSLAPTTYIQQPQPVMQPVMVQPQMQPLQVQPQQPRSIASQQVVSGPTPYYQQPMTVQQQQPSYIPQQQMMQQGPLPVVYGQQVAPQPIFQQQPQTVIVQQPTPVYVQQAQPTLLVVPQRRPSPTGVDALAIGVGVGLDILLHSGHGHHHHHHHHGRGWRR